MNTLQNVREGMRVVDASGTDIGTVATVKMGDPEAVTAEGQETERHGLYGMVADALSGGPDIPAERQERLLRLGYVEIDTHGIGRHLVAAADRIDRVTTDDVVLSVSADAL